MSAETRTALVAGATGLVGSHLLLELLGSPLYGSVTALVRRSLEEAHEKLRSEVIDFERLADLAPSVLEADDVFCCLGTTIKKAETQEAFRRVDHDYVVELARLSRARGATRFLLVSAIGASSRSRVFYSRVKGETEESVSALGFPELHIFRSGLLRGHRQEERPTERALAAVAQTVDRLLVGPLRRYRSIRAEVVARAMAGAALTGGPGHHVHTHDEMDRLAGR